MPGRSQLLRDRGAEAPETDHDHVLLHRRTSAPSRPIIRPGPPRDPATRGHRRRSPGEPGRGLRREAAIQTGRKAGRRGRGDATRCCRERSRSRALAPSRARSPSPARRGPLPHPGPCAAEPRRHRAATSRRNPRWRSRRLRPRPARSPPPPRRCGVLRGGRGEIAFGQSSPGERLQQLRAARRDAVASGRLVRPPVPAGGAAVEQRTVEGAGAARRPLGDRAEDPRAEEILGAAPGSPLSATASTRGRGDDHGAPHGGNREVCTKRGNRLSRASSGGSGAISGAARVPREVVRPAAGLRGQRRGRHLVHALPGHGHGRPLPLRGGGRPREAPLGGELSQLPRRCHLAHLAQEERERADARPERAQLLPSDGSRRRGRRRCRTRQSRPG